MKKMNRRLFIYFLLFKKRLFVISNDHKHLTSKHEVTDDSIRALSYAELKTIKIIQSCIYSEQLDTAQRYVDLLYKQYPYSTIINRLRILDIQDLRLGNKRLKLEPLTSILDKDEIELAKNDNKAVVKYLNFLKNYNHELNIH